MAIMSRPLSERGRSEYDRIFGSDDENTQAKRENLKVIDCKETDCEFANKCNGKWCIK